MIRLARSFLRFLLAGSLAVGCAAAFTAKAQNAPSSKTAKTEPSKPAKKTDPKADEAGKPLQVASYGDWGAFVATQGGKKKTCYALAQPKERAPSNLKRDPAYVFISSRPAENVRNEISIIMGFPMKDNGDAEAEIGTARFELIAKGSNAWVKNPAEEGQFIEALKKGSKLVIKAASIKNNMTTDAYSLTGLAQALDRVRKECP